MTVTDEQEDERPRPRVVDKRGGRGVGAPSEPTADAPGTPATPSGSDATTAEEPPIGSVADQSGGTDEPAPPTRQEVWTPEQEAAAQAMADQIAATSGIELVVQTAVSLANIAAMKLDGGQDADARLVIDALGGIIKETGSQLGNVEQPLRQTLAQLQMAYAERTAP